MNSSPSVILIGIDGATWDALDPLLSEGGLPVLGALRDRGIHGILRSTLPPVTPCAWSTMMTGVNPGKHGVFEFERLDTGARTIQLTSGEDRRCETVWSILDRHDISVGLLNVPWTYPPIHLENGFCLSGFGAPEFGPQSTEPQELFSVAVQEGNPWDLESVMATEDRDRGRQLAVEHASTIFRSATALLRRRPVDVFMVGIMSVDHAQHRFMDEDIENGEVGDVLRDAYSAVDRHLGEFLDRFCEPRTQVVVASDHGAAPLRGMVNLDRVLVDAGLCHLRAQRSSAGSAWLAAERLARPLVPVLRAVLPAKARSAAVSASKSVSKHADVGIDWEKSQCVPWGGWGAVAVCDRAATPETLRSQRAAVCTHLDGLRCPQTGQPIEFDVVCRDEAFKGPWADAGGDLYVFPRNWALHGRLFRCTRQPAR